MEKEPFYRFDFVVDLSEEQWRQLEEEAKTFNSIFDDPDVPDQPNDERTNVDKGKRR